MTHRISRQRWLGLLCLIGGALAAVVASAACQPAAPAA